MKKHILLETNVETSRLGFGCVQLTAHHNRKEALSILEHAFALGIRHFDVARAYGFGRAEEILREFLRQKRHQVTLTTKFGIQPPSGLAGNIRVINALKKVLRPFPGLLRQAKNRGAAKARLTVWAAGGYELGPPESWKTRIGPCLIYISSKPQPSFPQN